MQIAGGKYYIICLDFRFSKIYIIWIGDDVDNVLTDNGNKIVAFKSMDELMSFVSSSTIELTGDVATYNIYGIRQWLT